MKKYYVWYTACCVVEAESPEHLDSGNFTFVRNCSDSDDIETIIMENWDSYEEIQE